MQTCFSFVPFAFVPAPPHRYFGVITETEGEQPYSLAESRIDARLRPPRSEGWPP